jgi:hypothetical protein
MMPRTKIIKGISSFDTDHIRGVNAKMGFIRRTLSRLILGNYSKTASPNTHFTNNLDSRPSLSFKVYHATGGKIIECSQYDRQKDQYDFNLYVIGKEEDLSEKLSKIITLEALR